jgi:hypothetical protein
MPNASARSVRDWNVDWNSSIGQVFGVTEREDVYLGSAFAVSQNRILTALHVVSNRDQVPTRPLFDTFRIKFSHSTAPDTMQEVDASFDAEHFNHDEDWALLKTELLPASVKSIPLVYEIERGAAWYTIARPGEMGAPQLIAQGTISGIVPLPEPEKFDPVKPKAVKPGAKKAERRRTPVIQLYTEQAAAGPFFFAEGFSGSPVLATRKAFGAIDGKEAVCVGVLRTALKDDATGRVLAGTLFACPAAQVMKHCGAILPHYDSRRAATWRAIGRFFIGLFSSRAAFQPSIPLWAIGVGLLLALMAGGSTLFFAMNFWPEEWAIRANYDGEPSLSKPSFALDAFPRVPLSDEYDRQAKEMLERWKSWTALNYQPANNERYLVVNQVDEFEAWYRPFDLQVDVTYEVKTESGGIVTEKARLTSGAAFLVSGNRDIIRNVSLPRYRQQLVFIDASRVERDDMRPTMIHLSPPNKGDKLLLLLRVVTNKEAPASASKFKVSLKRIESQSSEVLP